MSSWLSKIGKSISKGLNKAVKTFTNPTSAFKEFSGSSILAGIGIPSVSGVGSSLVDWAKGVDWQREGYRFLEGYIPGTNINPIDRYLGRDIAQQNFQYQKDAYEYQKWLNEQQMAREDTAYQRKLSDLVGAGFNPIFAAGGSGEASSPLRAGSPPQMADTSVALREGIGQALGIMTGFAGLNKTKAETSLLKSQKEYQDIINAHQDEYLSGRNLGQNLDNQWKSSSLPGRLTKLTNEIDLQDLQKIHQGFQNELSKLGIDKAELELIYQRLGNADLAQKIRIDTLALLYKTQEYEAYKYSRDFYENRYHVPTGFNLSTMFGALIGTGSRLAPVVKNFLGALFGSAPDPNAGHGASRSFDDDGIVPFDPDDYRWSPGGNEALWNFLKNSFYRDFDGVRRNSWSTWD